MPIKKNPNSSKKIAKSSVGRATKHRKAPLARTQKGRMMPSKRLSRTQLLAFALIFGAVGAYVVFRSFAATTQLTIVQAETMTPLSATTTVISDPTATGDNALNTLKLTANATLTAPFTTAQPVTSITIRAKGIQCQGAPQVVVKVGDTTIPAISVSSTGWADYSANIDRPSGSSVLSISFTNDNTYTHQNARKNCSRDLYVDKITLFGTQSDTGAGTTTINDHTTGTAANQFEYVGAWTNNLSDPSAYNTDQNYSNVANAYYQVRFTGTQIKVYTITDPNRGRAEISIDGEVKDSAADSYSTGHTGGFLLYSSPSLTNTTHTLKVRVTGDKNPSSSNTYIVADRVEVSSGGTVDPTPPPVSGTPVPTGVPGTWTLNPSLSDEFNATAVDLNKWSTNWFGATTSSITQNVNYPNDRTCFDPANTSVGGGNLTFRAERSDCTFVDSSGKTVTLPYRSGILQSLTKGTTYQYGVTEARIWLPGTGGDGTTPIDWPAFWTTGTGTWPATGENDIMEVSNGQVCYHYHSSAPTLDGCTAAKSGWHTFAANWQSSGVTYYYDGVQVGHFDISIASRQAVILVLQTGTTGTYDHIVPAEMKVDYVRVWQ